MLAQSLSAKLCNSTEPLAVGGGHSTSAINQTQKQTVRRSLVLLDFGRPFTLSAVRELLNDLPSRSAR